MKFDAQVTGKTIIFQVTYNQDLTGYKVRAELYDDFGASVQLATANSGGSNSQISFTVSSGITTITITVANDETDSFEGTAHLEIEIENVSGQIFSLLSGKTNQINMLEQKINWSTPT